MEFACRRYAGDAGLSRRTDGTPKRVGAGVQGRCPCLDIGKSPLTGGSGRRPFPPDGSTLFSKMCNFY